MAHKPTKILQKKSAQADNYTPHQDGTNVICKVNLSEIQPVFPKTNRIAPTVSQRIKGQKKVQ